MTHPNSHLVKLPRNDIWNLLQFQDFCLDYIGLSETTARHIITEYENQVPLSDILASVYKTTPFFAFILSKSDEVFCAVDPTRSFPIAFQRETEGFAVGGFDQLVDYENIVVVDNEITMFLASGYCLSDKTISKDVGSLAAGNYLVFRNDKVVITEYRRYAPKLFDTTVPDETKYRLHERLDDAINASIRRTIEKANGRKIVLSLSAGLDSRVILSKLLENKYDNLECISWGPRGNGDSVGAAKIAAQVRVPWRHVETNREFCRSVFWSDLRKEFWKYAFNGVSIPSFQEFFVLTKLLDAEGYSADNVLFVNGQSGDYNSGGHLPNVNATTGRQKLVYEYIAKHFGLFPKLVASRDFRKIVEAELRSQIGNHAETINDLISALDVLEFYERQSKWVINGQRSADFFGCMWDLPLWNPEFVEFFEGVTYQDRVNQACFKSYLKDFDPFCLFQADVARPKWTGTGSLAIPVARLVGLLLGSNAKTTAYRYFAYYGINHDQFSVYSLSDFLRVAPSLRNIISLHALTFIEEFSNLGVTALENRKSKLLL